VWFDQDAYALRCEWGAAGVAALAPHVDVIVLVDVLSFSTCVDIAVSRGAHVYPYPWKDASATAFAESLNAVLAGPRSHQHVSLSPRSLSGLHAGTRIVLPSPNGATLSRITGRVPTLTGCLRNAAAVARAAQVYGARIGLVPAGEQWPDGSLRPCIEDWLGAGAIFAHLTGAASPEAELARDAFGSRRSFIADVVAASASGRELIDHGWADDVGIAAQLDVSATVPVLIDHAYAPSPAAVDSPAI